MKREKLLFFLPSFYKIKRKLIWHENTTFFYLICSFFVMFKHNKLKNTQVISPFWEPALVKTLLNQTCILNSVHQCLRTQAILSGLFLLYAVHFQTWIYDIPVCSNDFFFSITKSISVIGTWLTDFIGHKFIYFHYLFSLHISSAT